MISTGLLRHLRARLQDGWRNSQLQVRACSSSRHYQPRRAMLYVPGDDERKVKKVSSLNVDCAVMDCEDGVALNRKVGVQFIFYSYR